VIALPRRRNAHGLPSNGNGRSRATRGALVAGALLGSLPVAALHSCFVEYHVAGMAGAVKE
jgi:ABC-type maltose transport system permease subunit